MCFRDDLQTARLESRFRKGKPDCELPGAVVRLGRHQVRVALEGRETLGLMPRGGFIARVLRKPLRPPATELLPQKVLNPSDDVRTADDHTQAFYVSLAL